MTTHRRRMLALLTLVFTGILGKYVYTLGFTIGPLPEVTMNFTALPAIIGSLILGPIYGALIGGVVDLLGHLLHPVGEYLPGVTVMAIARGLLPGLLYPLMRTKNLFQSILFSVGLSQVIASVLVGSWVLFPFFETSWGRVLVSRTITQLFAIPIFSFVVYTVLKQKQMIEKSRETDERYRTLIDNIPGVVFRCRLDDSWTMVYVSNSIDSILGYPASDFVENAVRTFASVIHPADRQSVRKGVFSQLHGRKHYEETYRLLSRDGNTKWVVERGRVLCDVHGTAQFIDGIISDITQLKESEEALRASEEKYRSIVQVIPDIICRFDRHGTYLGIYAAAEHLLVSGKEELLGQRIQDFLPPRQSQLFAEAIERALDSQQLESFEYDLVVAGHSLWFEARLLPVHQQELVALIRDVTQRKEAEQQAADYLEEVTNQREELSKLYQRLDTEMDRARLVHQRLLQTKFPQVEGITVTAYNQPATYIGGDFYGILRKEHLLIIYLSDVTGHGLDGAMFSTFVKHTISSFVDLNPVELVSPENILRYLDAKVRRDNYPSEYAVAMFIMVLDLRNETIAYSGVGFQNPPIVIEPDGQCHFLVSRGLPISPDVPVEVMEFASKQHQLAPACCLFLATDGLYEQQGDAGYYENRLLALLQTNAKQPKRELATAIEEDFGEFLGSREQDDDVTFLLIHLDRASDQDETLSSAAVTSNTVVAESEKAL